MENSSKETVLAQNHDVTVTESIKTIMIGGVEVQYKHFAVPRSKEMETYLNQQSIIKVASPRVSQSVITNAIGGLKGLVSGGGNGSKKSFGKLAQTLMTILVSPNPSVIFGGECDALIDKKVCSGAIMSRMQAELPSIIPTLFMDKFFDDGEGEGDGNTAANNSGNGGPIALM